MSNFIIFQSIKKIIFIADVKYFKIISRKKVIIRRRYEK